MREEGRAVAEVTADVYVIPTETPEADGTLAWDKTTMVVASGRAGQTRGLGWTYAAAAAGVSSPTCWLTPSATGGADRPG